MCGDELSDRARRGRRTPRHEPRRASIRDADLIASGLDSIRMMSLSGRWRKQGIDVEFAALAAEPDRAAWIGAGGRDHAADARAAGPAALVDVRRGTTPTTRSRSRRCSTRCGWAATTISNSAASPPISTSSSTARASIPTRLRDAAAKLAARHPMLRVEILPDGTQRIGDRGLPVTVLRPARAGRGGRRGSGWTAIRDAEVAPAARRRGAAS